MRTTGKPTLDGLKESAANGSLIVTSIRRDVPGYPGRAPICGDHLFHNWRFWRPPWLKGRLAFTCTRCEEYQQR